MLFDWLISLDSLQLIATWSSLQRIAAISLGIVAAIIAIVLYVASRTKWGQINR